MFADQKPAIIILFKMIRSNNYSSSILPKWMIYNSITLLLTIALKMGL